jgi:unsaturated rhamnogalacturonyl hydrolase
MSTDATLIERLAHTLVHLPYETWNFGDSIAFEALLAASDSSGEQRWASFAHGWARAWATRATPYRRLDCTAPGSAIVHLAERFDDPALLRAAIDLAEYLLRRPKLRGVYETWEHSPLMRPYGSAILSSEGQALLADPPAGVFVDCLHFDPPFFAALARATGDPRYASEAVEQAVGYITVLQRSDGLFDHFILRGRQAAYGPGWGRGQGWALLGLLDVLIEFAGMPDATRKRHGQELDQIANGIQRLVHAQVGYQRSDGHWFAVVDDLDSGEEHSTAAFMAAGFLRALEHGWVAGADIERSAHAAVAAVRNGIDAAGTLSEVSAAVMACTESSHYANVPRGFRVPWGQGPALIALTCADTTGVRGSVQSST